ANRRTSPGGSRPQDDPGGDSHNDDWRRARRHRIDSRGRRESDENARTGARGATIRLITASTPSAACSAPDWRRRRQNGGRRGGPVLTARRRIGTIVILFSLTGGKQTWSTGIAPSRCTTSWSYSCATGSSRVSGRPATGSPPRPS